MKKMIPFVIILLSFATVMAPEPCPLGFKFLTSPPDANEGLTVQLKYFDKTWIVPETYPGEYMIDLGDQEISNCLTQNFELVVVDCQDNPVCHQTVSFNPNGYTTIDLTSANLFPQTTVETTILTTTETTICPEIPEECFSRAECLEMFECEECPDLTVDYVITVIITAIISAGLSYGYGLKFYKKSTGEVSTMHMHPGIKGYHSIYTVHMNPKIRHPKGMVIPKYEKVNNEWQYKGG